MQQKCMQVDRHGAFPMRYVRQRKYETFSNFVSSFGPSLQIRFVDRLTELRDRVFVQHFGWLQPHHASYTGKNAFSEKRSK